MKELYLPTMSYIIYLQCVKKEAIYKYRHAQVQHAGKGLWTEERVDSVIIISNYTIHSPQCAVTFEILLLVEQIYA